MFYALLYNTNVAKIGSKGRTGILTASEKDILRAVMFTELTIELFYSKARRGNRCISSHVTVFATQLSDKMADEKTENVTARSIKYLFGLLALEPCYHNAHQPDRL
jgi:hypothetical protein